MKVLSQAHIRLSSNLCFIFFPLYQWRLSPFATSYGETPVRQQHKYSILSKLMSHFNGMIVHLENTSTCSTLLQFVDDNEIYIALFCVNNARNNRQNLKSEHLNISIVFCPRCCKFELFLPVRVIVNNFNNDTYVSCWCRRKVSPVWHHWIFVFSSFI